MSPFAGQDETLWLSPELRGLDSRRCGFSRASSRVESSRLLVPRCLRTGSVLLCCAVVKCVGLWRASVVELEMDRGRVGWSTG